MIKKILILIALLSSFCVFGESLDFRDIILNRPKVKYIKLKYITFKGDNLAKIYKRFVKDDSIISEKEPMVQKTYKANPKVQTWNYFPYRRKVYIYLDVSFVDINKITKYNKQVGALSKKLKKSIEKDKTAGTKPTGFRGSVFYMASYGKFSQDNPELASIEFLQNSPVSLGFTGSYYPKKGDFSFSSSIYYSYLLAAASNLGEDSITAPAEVGLNAYAEYRFKKYHMSGYAGFDFEKFTTFNLEAVQQEREIFFDENKVFYFTAGVSRGVKIFGMDFFTKLSFSQSLSSSRTTSYSGATDDTAFSGNKILLYLFKRWNEKLFVHSLFKYHWMSGPSDITTLRLGVGVGYLLF